MNTQAFSERNGQRSVQEGMWQPRPSLSAKRQLNGDEGGSNEAALEASLCSIRSRLPSATAYNLSLLPWVVIGVLTFGAARLRSQSPRAADKRARLYRRWLAEVCMACDLRLRYVCAFAKTEYGSNSDNPHYHFLIGYTKPMPVSPDEFAYAAKELWTGASPWRDKFGTMNGEWQAELEPFQPDLAARGIDYATKDEVDRYGNPRVPEELYSTRLRTEIRNRNAQAAGEFQFAC